MTELVRALALRCHGCHSDPWRVSVPRERVTVAYDHRVGTLWLGHFAIVMLGTPTRGTSVTVIWNKRYSNWKASRFQRANGPVVFTA